MKRTLVVALAAACAWSPAWAITDNEANASVSFSFSNPGARALGMGGAFLGLADDASAAYANPAGLVQLVTPELAAEVRTTRTDTRWVQGGNSSGLNYASQTDTSTALRSFSFVYPFERVSFAIYRYGIVDYDSNFRSNGIELDGSTVFPYDARSNFEVETYGAALGFKATDRFSIGFGVNYYRLDINSVTDRYNVDGNGIVNREANVNGSSKFGGTIGLRYAFNDWVSLGASYRYAPKLGYDAILSNPGVGTGSFRLRTALDVPDVLGIGISLRPSEAWLVNFDVNRVRYGQVTNGLTSLFGTDAAGVVDPDYRASELDPLRLSDGTEVRLGAEYTFSTRVPFSLRGGVWRDPAHELRYRGAAIDNSVNAFTFSSGRGEQTHYALGAGVAFQHFQLDFGADFSDSMDSYSLSGVYRF